MWSVSYGFLADRPKLISHSPQQKTKQSPLEMQKVYVLFLFFLLLAGAIHARQAPTTKILLIPLDDRPPCLQFPEKMGLIAGAEVIAPPKELLGKFTQAGNPEANV